MRLHRTQILLLPDQHQALLDVARDEGRSLSDVVREAVERDLRRRGAEPGSRSTRRLAWLRRAGELRDRIEARRGGRPIDPEPAELLRQLRDERDDELMSVSRADGGH